MDPVGAAALVAAIVQQVNELVRAAVAVNAKAAAVAAVNPPPHEAWAVRHELATLKFQLTVVDGEVQRGTVMRLTGDWWDLPSLLALLLGAQATLDRLGTIFTDQEQQQEETTASFKDKHDRFEGYDREIRHLRHRLKVCTSSLALVVNLSVSSDCRRYGFGSDYSQPTLSSC